MPEEENEVLRDVEEEVKRVLRERRVKPVARKPLTVRYFKSIEQVSEKPLEKLLEDGILLIALREDSMSRVKPLIEKLAERVKEVNGDIYLVRWPSLLIAGDKARIEVHEPGS
ncbi:MAG: hypothetical protein DRN61_03940 [Thaumarchaeota archaeon]|nr:MAG: hypothetical protein DRN54_03865 [Nitrososphaerota archaeon]RLG03921.1 MAG: hypothetical protein DRN61_03940 [Nitrososphaerota archaeon]